MHPRFKFFPETREERYHSFLGVPVLERRAPLGVLVVQTLRRRQFTPDEISLLRTIAGQLAGVLVQARLLDSLKIKEQEQADFRRRMLDTIRRLQAFERQGGAQSRHGESARDPGERLRGNRRVAGLRDRPRAHPAPRRSSWPTSRTVPATIPRPSWRASSKRSRRPAPTSSASATR